MFGIRPAAVRGAVVELRALESAAAGLGAGLEAGQDPEEMLERLEANLAGRCADVLPSAAMAECEEAIDMIERNPALRIADVAAKVGMSHADLDRAFVRHVGLTPRGLARIAKLRRLTSRVTGGHALDWAVLAAEFGWYDQAHLIRDFKRHTGVTPAAFISSQKKVKGPASVEASRRDNPTETTGVAFVPD